MKKTTVLAGLALGGLGYLVANRMFAEEAPQIQEAPQINAETQIETGEAAQETIQEATITVEDPKIIAQTPMLFGAPITLEELEAQLLKSQEQKTPEQPASVPVTTQDVVEKKEESTAQKTDYDAEIKASRERQAETAKRIAQIYEDRVSSRAERQKNAAMLEAQKTVYATEQARTDIATYEQLIVAYEQKLELLGKTNAATNQYRSEIDILKRELREMQKKLNDYKSETDGLEQKFDNGVKDNGGIEQKVEPPANVPEQATTNTPATSLVEPVLPPQKRYVSPQELAQTHLGAAPGPEEYKAAIRALHAEESEYLSNRNERVQYENTLKDLKAGFTASAFDLAKKLASVDKAGARAFYEENKDQMDWSSMRFGNIKRKALEAKVYPQ
ncbi:hypothetical protein HY486_04575 [Candidatus Woesearchaeota archaeon]|nr:hypothetical protein [Candidatus Woesearchaeota archaeon]